MFFIGGVPFVGIAKKKNQRKLYFSRVYMKLPSYNLTGYVKENLNLLLRHVQMIRIVDSDLCHKRTDKQKKYLYISHAAPDSRKAHANDFVHNRCEQFSAESRAFSGPRDRLVMESLGEFDC